ncbi:MAG: CARDB domain-containing protein [Nanoarchaeota archaeon]
MNINFLLFVYTILACFFITNSYSLACTEDGLVTGVEFSIDDNSFDYNFDGKSGVIYKLKFNNTLEKYELWITDNLPKRNDLGYNIMHDIGIDPSSNLVDSTSLGDILKIDTSLFNKLYVKETLKNTGSCQNYQYQTLKHYSYIYNVGGSGNHIRLTEFGGRRPYIDVGNEIVQLYNLDINGLYSGDLRIRSWIRKGSTPYSPTFQRFFARIWLDGESLKLPQVTRSPSNYISNPIVQGATNTISYTFYNPSNTNSKNITFRFRTWSGDGNARLNLNRKYDNIENGMFTLLPRETKVYEYNYTIPFESDYYALNAYRADELVKYTDDPILGDRILLRSWPRIGSLDHSYLATDILEETFVQGTTNEGIPYVGADYLLKEYNQYYNTGVNSGDYDYEILLYKKNSTSLWNNFYTRRTTFNQNINNNQKIKQKLVFPLYDFKNWVDYKIRLNIQSYWNNKDWKFFHDTTSGGQFDINLDFSHLLMSTDLPLYIYPDGGSQDVYIRDVLFNLKDYKLNNVSFKIDIVNPLTDITSTNFIISNPTNFDVPAQASYPVPINIKYLGPVEDKRYTIKINYSYYDEINNINTSKMLSGDIYIKPDAVSEDYKDIIPIMLEYGNLYVNKTSNIEVKLANQGNIPIGSPYKVSLYYKKLGDDDFYLIDSKTVPGNANKVNFNFKPTQTGNIVLKVIVDKNGDIDELSTYSLEGESNNELASIAFVRDIDLVLETARPLYDEFEKQSVIPFKIVVRNKGVGGIDEFDIDLNISWEGEYWYFNETFNNIPEEGRTFIYYWNVSLVTPGVHTYSARAIPEYDLDFSNNIKSGAMDFCPLPWKSSAIECFSNCAPNCLYKNTQRYLSSCNGINGCNFYNDTFAQSCNHYLKDSYIKFNSTHDAICPDASQKRHNTFTNQRLNISGVDCNQILIEKQPALLEGQTILINFINCIK